MPKGKAKKHRVKGHLRRVPGQRRKVRVKGHISK